MKTATVRDMTPARLRRLVEQQHTAQAARGIFADLTDGGIVVQFMLNFAGFSYEETKFVEKIYDLCGASGQITRTDKDLADLLRCSDRTVRNWRPAYMKGAKRVSYYPLGIVEGEYKDKCYAPTAYTVAPEVAQAIEQSVAMARTRPEYATDRLRALEQAAAEFYEDIPDAPPKRRTNKPKSKPAGVLGSIKSARRSLDRSKQKLADLNGWQRDHVLEQDGAEMRAALLEMQAQIGQLLSALPQPIEAQEVKDTPENVSYPPAETDTPENVSYPPAETDTPENVSYPPAETDTPENISYPLDVMAAAGEATRFRVREENTRKPTAAPAALPADVASFDQFMERARGKPAVASVELALQASDNPSADADEISERAAILEFEAGLDRNEAERLASGEIRARNGHLGSYDKPT